MARMSLRSFLATALLALLPMLSLASEQDGQPYRVTVWSLVLFDTSGQAKEIEVADASRYSAQFLDNVRSRLAKARVPPPQEGGAAATFKSGVRMEFLMTPSAAGGSARVVGLSVAPLPTKTYFASYPKDVAGAEGWEGAVSALCTVGVEGTCTAIAVKALPGMPDSVRRFARASLEGWVFIPQEVNGKPVVGEYELTLKLRTLDGAPEDFRENKFDRILRSR